MHAPWCAHCPAALAAASGLASDETPLHPCLLVVSVSDVAVSAIDALNATVRTPSFVLFPPGGSEGRRVSVSASDAAELAAELKTEVTRRLAQHAEACEAAP